jgi:sugar fermentation stimulation protein A
MEFPHALLRATLVRRYKRFLSDHTLENGEPVTAHCPNPGAMTGLDTPGAETWLAPVTSATAKLPFRWTTVRVGERLVGIDTQAANPVAEEAVRARAIPELTGYGSLRREVRYGTNSRIDLLLEDDARTPCYVEVKTVNLRRAVNAEFPDAVTKRGAKHMAELAAMAEAGARAVVLFVVQRDDCDAFNLADDIDPTYAAAFADARARGVEALCYCCKLAIDSISLERAIPIVARDP